MRCRLGLPFFLAVSLAAAGCGASSVPDASIDDATTPRLDAQVVADAGFADAVVLPDDATVFPDAAAPDAADPCAGRGGDTDGDTVCDDVDLCGTGDDRVDTDRDGVPDGCDRCDRGDDGVDTDLDGVPDACDACAAGPDGVDADMDGVADACDLCPGSDDRLDADLDLVPDACDLCAVGDDRVDVDMDGVPEACDRCALGDDALDVDLDTVPDACDRCPEADDRVDGDGDGAPDACDVCPLDNPDDPDGDGVCTAVDLCVLGSDTIDDDGDAVPTACDNCPSFFNPGQEDTTGVSASTVAFAPEPPGGAVFAATDDSVTSSIAIGFPFRFFGVTYDALVISSNGFISFDEAPDSGCCQGRGIPFTDDVNNMIALGWTDLYPADAGTISYELRGTAPNRRFVVSYSDIPIIENRELMSPDLTAQAILFEGSNDIVVHTTTLTPGNQQWTRGVESRTGTQAAYLLGQRADRFALRQESVLFTTNPEPDDVGDDCDNADDVQFEGGSGSGGSGSGGSGSGGSGSGGSGSGSVQ